MWQKVAAAAIVLAIGGIAGGFLYSPVKIAGPAVPAISASVPEALTPAPAAEVVTPLVPAQPRPPISSVPVVASSTIRDVAPPPPSPSLPDPAAAQPLLAREVPATSGVTVPAVTGRVPTVAAARPRGPFQVAGQSVGAAFATTGRSLRAAFKRAF